MARRSAAKLHHVDATSSKLGGVLTLKEELRATLSSFMLMENTLSLNRLTGSGQLLLVHGRETPLAVGSWLNSH